MTAVEFLLRQFALLGYDVHKYETIINEAKEMEKKQIINARYDGKQEIRDFDIMKCRSDERYYNETFKQQEQ